MLGFNEMSKLLSKYSPRRSAGDRMDGPSLGDAKFIVAVGVLDAKVLDYD